MINTQQFTTTVCLSRMRALFFLLRVSNLYIVTVCALAQHYPIHSLRIFYRFCIDFMLERDQKGVLSWFGLVSWSVSVAFQYQLEFCATDQFY
jgi:hypothetical protein